VATQNSEEAYLGFLRLHQFRSPIFEEDLEFMMRFVSGSKKNLIRIPGGKSRQISFEVNFDVKGERFHQDGH